MRPQISRILLVAAIAGLVLTSPAGARPVFDGKVCGLLTAKQIATVPGLSPACRNARIYRSGIAQGRAFNAAERSLWLGRQHLLRGHRRTATAPECRTE